MSPKSLDRIKKGDILVYNKKSCVVLYKLRKDIIRDIYKSQHPVFRVEFSDGHKMCLSKRNANDFNYADVDQYKTNEDDEEIFSDEKMMKHYEEIADAMR